MRGGSAVGFNSTFLTLLVGGYEAFCGPTSPSASGPEGLSRGPVDAQERNWLGPCAQRLQGISAVGLCDEQPLHPTCPPEREEQGVTPTSVTTLLQRSLICIPGLDKQDS